MALNLGRSPPVSARSIWRCVWGRGLLLDVLMTGDTYAKWELRDAQHCAVLQLILQNQCLCCPECFGAARAVVLNLWVANLLGVKRPYHGGRLRPSGKQKDVYMTIHNGSKITVIE